MKKEYLREIEDIINANLKKYEPVVYVFRVIGTIEEYIHDGDGNMTVAFNRQQAELVLNRLKGYCSLNCEIIKLK